MINNKKFMNAKNTSNGEVSAETIFHYKQNANLIEATYSGGAVKQGHIIGVMTGDHTFRMYYQHINLDDELRVGECQTTIAISPLGKIELIEKWRWLNGDCSEGQSILIEYEESSK